MSIPTVGQHWTGSLDNLPVETPKGTEWHFETTTTGEFVARLINIDENRIAPSIDQVREAAGLTPSYHLSNLSEY